MQFRCRRCHRLFEDNNADPHPPCPRCWFLTARLSAYGEAVSAPPQVLPPVKDNE